MKQTSLVFVLIVIAGIPGFGMGTSNSQNQMHFASAQDRRAGVFSERGRDRSYPLANQRLMTRHKPAVSRAMSLAGKYRVPARHYTSSAVGKSGFVSAAQIPAGGGLSSSGQFPTLEADFNGDGNLDVATVVEDLAASPRVLSISVALGNGNGTFTVPVLTAISGNACLQFVTGDVNGDGKDDIILVHQVDSTHASATADVLISKGDGTFTTANTYDITSNSLVGGTVGDVNRDGKLDLVLEDNANPANEWTLLGNGDGTFKPATAVSLGAGQAIYVVFSDLNGDGLLDIAQISTNGQLSVYLATSSSSFSPPAYYQASGGPVNAFGLSAGDLNGDGRPELIVPNGTDNRITVFMNNGDGTYQTGVYYDVALGAAPNGSVADVCPLAVAVADVNGDGNADVITSNNHSSDITVFLGNGDGTIREPGIGYAVGGFPSTPAIVADFDGDGIDDILVSDGEFSLAYLKGRGDGTFTTALNYYAPIADGGVAYGSSLASGDFNGDGQMDFVIGSTADPTVGITVFVSKPDGTLSPGVNYGGGDYQSIAVADFDQDGHPDIAVADTSAGVVRVFRGVGDGTFTAGAQFASDFSNADPTAIVAADLNNDGYPDIAVVNYQGKNVGILLNDRHGGFVLSATYPLSTYPVYPSNIVAGSLTGNGNMDLLVPLINPAVAILSGNGDGTFLGKPDLGVDDFPGAVAIHDLDGDGKADLAVTLLAGIDVVLGNGDGTFQTPQAFATSLQNSNWDIPVTSNVQVGDMDGDGIVDLVYTNLEFGTVGILFGTGNASFGPPLEFPAGGYPAGLALADLNRDGAPDVATVGTNFSGVTVLLNANGSGVLPGYTVFLSTSSTTVDAGSTAAVDITLTSHNYFNGTVSFDCAAMPPQVSCTFTPQSVQLGANQQVSVRLTMSNRAAMVRSSSGTSESPQSHRWGGFGLAGVGVFGMLVGSTVKHRNLKGLRLSLLCMTLFLVSCGGNATPPVQNNAGTYVLQVRATGVDHNSGLQVSRTVYLNVTVR